MRTHDDASPTPALRYFTSRLAHVIARDVEDALQLLQQVGKCDTQFSLRVCAPQEVVQIGSESLKSKKWIEVRGRGVVEGTVR